MTVCRFYQQGYCRYGNSCRFEHVYTQKYPNNQGPQNNQFTGAQNNQYQIVHPSQNSVTTEQLINQVSTDTSAALNGHQWRLSTYGPFKCKPNFPGMIDISAEELRQQMYEARTNGTLTQIEAQIAKYISESTEKLKSLSKPTGPIVGTIISLYKNETPEDPFVANSFNQNTNVFGGSLSMPTPNVFGSQTQNSPPTNMASSLFAEAAQTIFQAPTQNTFGSSIFGEPPKPAQIEPLQTNSFGLLSSGFNQTQPTVVQPSVFGSNLPQNTGNVFEQTPSSIPSSTLFSNANNTMAPTVQNNIFGQTPANTQSPFAAPTTNVFQQPSSNIFSNNANNAFDAANPFGVQSKVDLRPEIYSKLEDITENDLIAFKSDCFLPGQIPEIPPPMELCE